MKASIKRMIGKTYMYKGANTTIENLQELSPGNFLVSTPEDDYTLNENGLNDFLPVDNEIPAQAQVTILEVVKRESTQMANLSDILMDNIKKIQIDPAFIEQARAINESAKNLIDIKKTQVEMIKLLKS